MTLVGLPVLRPGAAAQPCERALPSQRLLENSKLVSPQILAGFKSMLSREVALNQRKLILASVHSSNAEKYLSAENVQVDEPLVKFFLDNYRQAFDNAHAIALSRPEGEREGLFKALANLDKVCSTCSSLPEVERLDQITGFISGDVAYKCCSLIHVLLHGHELFSMRKAYAPGEIELAQFIEQNLCGIPIGKQEDVLCLHQHNKSKRSAYLLAFSELNHWLECFKKRKPGEQAHPARTHPCLKPFEFALDEKTELFLAKLNALLTSGLQPSKPEISVCGMRNRIVSGMPSFVWEPMFEKFTHFGSPEEVESVAGFLSQLQETYQTSPRADAFLFNRLRLRLADPEISGEKWAGLFQKFANEVAPQDLDNLIDILHYLCKNHQSAPAESLSETISGFLKVSEDRSLTSFELFSVLGELKTKRADTIYLPKEDNPFASKHRTSLQVKRIRRLTNESASSTRMLTLDYVDFYTRRTVSVDIFAKKARSESEFLGLSLARSIFGSDRVPNTLYAEYHGWTFFMQLHDTASLREAFGFIRENGLHLTERFYEQLGALLAHDYYLMLGDRHAANILLHVPCTCPNCIHTEFSLLPIDREMLFLPSLSNERAISKKLLLEVVTSLFPSWTPREFESLREHIKCGFVSRAYELQYGDMTKRRIRGFLKQAIEEHVLVGADRHGGIPVPPEALAEFDRRIAEDPKAVFKRIWNHFLLEYDTYERHGCKGHGCKGMVSNHQKV